MWKKIKGWLVAIGGLAVAILAFVGGRKSVETERQGAVTDGLAEIERLRKSLEEARRINREIAERIADSQRELNAARTEVDNLAREVGEGRREAAELREAIGRSAAIGEEVRIRNQQLATNRSELEDIVAELSRRESAVGN